MPQNDIAATMKMIKWARKQGACLIKVNGVELTFPPDIDAPRSTLRSVPLDVERTIDVDSVKAEKALRAALTTDHLNQIEDQEKWFYNNKPPQI